MVWHQFSDRFVGNLLKGQTVGVIGAGRIGSAYARMMVISHSIKGISYTATTVRKHEYAPFLYIFCKWGNSVGGFNP